MASFRVQNKGSPQIRLTTLLVSEESGRGQGDAAIFFDGASSGAREEE